MKQKLIHTLISEGYFTFGNYELKNGRLSPYLAKFPSEEGLSETAFNLLALNAIKLFSNLQSFHLVGLANSGTKLTLSIFEAIRLSSKEVSCEIINPKSLDILEYKAQYSKPIVIIDNAITTGETLISLKRKLMNQCGCFFNTAIRIFDRMEIDNEHGTVDDYLFEKHGISVLSILNVYDLIAYLTFIGQDQQSLSIDNYCTAYCKKLKLGRIFLHVLKEILI